MLTILFVTSCILLIGYFSGMEIGCYSINRIRLKSRKENNDINAVRLAGSMSQPQRFIFATLICQNIFVYLASRSVTEWLLGAGLPDNLIFEWGLFPWSAEVAATLILLVPIFIFGEVWPKLLFRAKADTLMYQFTRFQRFYFVILSPVTKTLKFITDILTGKHQDDHGSEYDKINISKLQLILTESSRYGTISKEQNTMILNTIELKTIPITEIMLPINRIISFPAESNPGDLLKQYKIKKFDVIPIYKGRKDEIIGVVYFFDLLKALKEKTETITPYISEIVSMSSGLYIDQVYSAFHSKRKIISLVLNQHNKIVGIIWMKDIIRYITEYSINE